MPADWVVTSTAADHVARGAHPALDLAPPGRSGLREPIYAAAAGQATIQTAHGYSEWGNYVLLEHDSIWQTGYAHCDALLVRAGDTVEAGQVIGLAGDSGKTNGNVHLHLELFSNGTRVDPWPRLLRP